MCDSVDHERDPVRIRTGGGDLAHDPEQLERVDRADDQVVIGVLAVVEVEAAEQPLGKQERDDLLDVGALCMVAGVDEHLGLRAEPPAHERCGPPVGQIRAVEGRLEELVLDEEPHPAGQARVQLLEPVDQARMPVTQVVLPRVVPPLGRAHDWLHQRWYELALDFGRGRYALIVDSDHYVAYFEDPATSELVERISYAAPPTGPTGLRCPNLWTWSMVMNTRAADKEAAWRFVEWATGREFLLRSVFEGNMNPTRRSIWDDEGFRSHTAGWGSFYEVARELVERDAFVLVTPAANYLEIARRWVRALLDAYAGRTDVAGALQAAAGDIDELVR